MEILNLGVLAHVDAGKTTTVEQLLYLCGVIRSPGSVDRGNTQTDWLPVERERGISVRASSTALVYRGRRINIIDTPGHMDFTGEVERALSVLDGAVLVVSALEGVQAQTRRFWQALRALGIPTLLFANKIDRTGCDPEALVEQLRKELSPAILPLHRVEEAGERGCGIVPAQWDEDWMLGLCETDDDLALRYLEGEPVSREEAADCLARGCAGGRAFPLAFGSAAQGVGMEELLEAVQTYLPAPESDPSGEASGVVYQIEHDKAMGKIAHVRLYGGVLRNRDTVLLSRPGRDPAEEKITQIRRISGSRREDTGVLEGGDIAAVYGLSSARTGDIVGRMAEGRGREYHIASPLFSVQVTAPPGRETEAMKAVAQLSDEDPLLDYEWEPTGRELVVKVMGAVQVEVLEHLLRERYDLRVAFSPPTVIYKETPLRVGRGYEEYTMPKPCWAVVELRMEPLPRGAGFQYESVIKDNVIHYRYQNHIRASVPETLKQGLMGWEVTDLKVTLTGGGDHHVHTHPLDFFLATPIAVMTGLVDCGTGLLEPVLQLDLTAAEELSGRLIGDILAMRGEFDSPVVSKGNVHIRALVPVKDSMDYSARFASLTAGKGIISTGFHSYRECPPEEGATRKRMGVNPLDRVKWILHRRSALGG